MTPDEELRYKSLQLIIDASKHFEFNNLIEAAEEAYEYLKNGTIPKEDE